MSNIYPIKAGFSGGILSLGATGRIDTERYRNGLSICNNWVVTPQGSLRLRRGTRFIENISADASDVRLISFPVNTGADVVVVLDGTNVTLRDRAGTIKGAGLFLDDPYFSAGEQFWKKSGSAFYLAHWNYESGYRVLLQAFAFQFGAPLNQSRIGIQQHVVAPPDTYKLKFAYAAESGRATPSEGNESVFDFIGVGGEILIGTAPDLGDIDSMTVPAAPWANPVDYEFDFTTLGTEFYVTMRLQGTAGLVYTTGAFYAPALLSGSVLTPQTFVSPWNGSQLRNIQVATDIDSGEMFLVHPNVQPYVLRYDYPTRAWSFAAVAFTAAPVEWTGSNWPSVVEIFQSRLWLASTPLQANTIWASKTGAYTDFTTGANPDDAIEISLAASGTILWMRGMDQMLIGTANGEIILGAESGAITGASFFLHRQNGYASTGIQATFVGRQIAYVGAGRRKVRVTQQSEEARGMMGTDISLVANDVFIAQIKEVHYALEPEYLMYAVLENGTVAVCTYDSQNDLLAWHTMQTPTFSGEVGGEIVSMCITQEEGGQALWLAIRRAGIFTLELIEPELFSRRFLDSFEIKQIETLAARAGSFSLSYSASFSGGYVAAETVRGITGLDRFNGAVVGIVFENANTPDGSIEYEVLPSQLVADGQVLVPNGKNGTCIVGLKYRATAITLPQEGGENAGTAQGSKRKWNRVFSRIGGSAMPLLNGYRAPPPANEIPSSLNPLDAVLTGDFEIRNEGYDGGIVRIEQDLPLRTEIAGIFGKSQSSAT